MGFNNETFMLKNEPAKKLYTQIADKPIFDYHCHLNPQDIFEDKPFDNIVDLWLGGDHYKWRLMRAGGVSENLITGQASKLDKFKAFAKVLEQSYGNPVYHWSAMELKNVFQIEEPLNEQNAEDIYHRVNHYLVDNNISPRKLIQDSRVTFIGTTDHPLDTLEWHKKIKEDVTFDVTVAPTFRPDEAFIEHQNFNQFVQRLADTTQQSITNFSSFIDALEERVVYFVEHGCRASDISFTEIVFAQSSAEELDTIFENVKNGQKPTPLEMKKWQTAVFRELCRLYAKYQLITQVHFGALRNNHSTLFERLGADIGVDSLGDQTSLAINLNKLLDDLVRVNSLPKMIWYNLNPSYNILLANTLANFQANEQGVKGYLQFGAGWWFADTKTGMLSQMTALSEQGLLASFVGMLTDSRSFLSYQRHDYFRRILCSYIGEWVVDGEVPADYETLGRLVSNIAYHNAVNYFENKA